MIERLHRWWEGKYLPPNNPPGSPLFFLQGHFERHWTARWASASWDYFKDHHRWIIGLLFAAGVAIFAKAK